MLPCSCGQKTPVERGQAGQRVHCACGAELEVPTLMGMKSLERVPDARTPSRGASGWGAGQRVALVGGVFLLAALGMAGWLTYTWPAQPYSYLKPDELRGFLEKCTPAQTLGIWLELRAQGLKPMTSRESRLYAQYVLYYKISLGIALFFAALGALVTIGALLAVRRGRRRPRGTLDDEFGSPPDATAPT